MEKYGSNRVLHYYGKYYTTAASESVNPAFISVSAKPYAFMPAEIEEIIAHYLRIIKDPEIKVIIISNSVNIAEICKEVKKARPDILLIGISPYDDPDRISMYANIIMQIDELDESHLIPQQAKKLGANTLIYYSYKRHMAIPFLRECRDIMKEVCEEIGIEFIYAEAVDPATEGIYEAQQFIEEDFPGKIEEHGQDTAFTTSSTALQISLIKSVIEQQAIMSMQTYHTYWYTICKAFDLEALKDKENDMQWLNEQINRYFAENKSDELTVNSEKIGKEVIPSYTSRLFSWPVSTTMLMGSAAVEYGMAYIEGQVGLELDEEVLQKCLQNAMQIYGYGNYKAYMTKHEDFDNYFLITEDFIVF